MFGCNINLFKTIQATVFKLINDVHNERLAYQENIYTNLCKHLWMSFRNIDHTIYLRGLKIHPCHISSFFMKHYIQISSTQMTFLLRDMQHCHSVTKHFHKFSCVRIIQHHCFSVQPFTSQIFKQTTYISLDVDQPKSWQLCTKAMTMIFICICLQINAF